MTYFNPISGALAGGTPVQRPAADKDRQIARSQALRKNTAAEGDRVEHQVESAEELAPVSREDSSGGRGGDPRGGDPKREDAAGKDEAPPHIDVKA